MRYLVERIFKVSGRLWQLAFEMIIIIIISLFHHLFQYFFKHPKSLASWLVTLYQ